MNNRQHLEFTQLLDEYATATYEVKKAKRDALIDFIERDFTPKTVEESYRLVKVQGVLTLASYHQYSDYASLFYGTRKQCEAEKQRLEQIKGHGGDALAYGLSPLTKGREEKGEFFCDSIDKGGVKCTSQCGFCCVFQPTESKPTPNRDNYREELLRVSETILAALITQEPAEGMQPFYTRTPQEKCDEAIALSKILINSIDKEVKSNPASE